MFGFCISKLNNKLILLNLKEIELKSTTISPTNFKKLQASFIFRSDSIEFQCECDGIFRNWTTITEFRRLSTKSSIFGKQGDNYLTEWKWYWKEKENDWREYTTGVITFFIFACPFNYSFAFDMI